MCLIGLTAKNNIHNLVKFRTKNFKHLDIGTLFSLKNKQGYKLLIVLLTVINILSHFICGKVKHELRVQIHELQVQIHELQAQIYELRVQIHALRVQIHESEH